MFSPQETKYMALLYDVSPIAKMYFSSKSYYISILLQKNIATLHF